MNCYACDWNLKSHQHTCTDLTGKTVTITRPSMIDGRPFTREVLVEGPWTTYRGIEVGYPVRLTTFPFNEILSAAEVATAR